MNRQGKGPLDLVLVVSERNRGWVLDTICREIAQLHPGRTAIHYRLSGLPTSRAYFFSHYSLFSACLRRDPRLRLRRNLVFFTHPSHDPSQASRIARRLSRADAVLSQSSLHARTLVADGVAASKVHVVLGGSDPARFRSHQRGDGVVGFCASFYERKDPERIAAIVRMMPHRRFLLVGRGWRRWSGFHALEAQPNFSYVEPEYDRYPEYYSAMDVFVSPGRLEGGPVPLLEAMMANVVPVCSRTGFGPDLIVQSQNGFLFDVHSPVDEVCRLVDRAATLQADVRASVLEYTLHRFGTTVQALADGVVPSTAGSSA